VHDSWVRLDLCSNPRPWAKLIDKASDRAVTTQLMTYRFHSTLLFGSLLKTRRAGVGYCEVLIV